MVVVVGLGLRVVVVVVVVGLGLRVVIVVVVVVAVVGLGLLGLATSLLHAVRLSGVVVIIIVRIVINLDIGSCVVVDVASGRLVNLLILLLGVKLHLHIRASRRGCSGNSSSSRSRLSADRRAFSSLRVACVELAG